MARVTVEDCLEKIPNRFALTILASRRARMLLEGRGTATVDCENKDAVTALREISASHVRFTEDVDTTMHEFIDEQRQKLRASSTEGSYLDAAAFGLMDAEEGEEPGAEIEELTADLERLVVKPKKEKADDDDDEVEAEEEVAPVEDEAEEEVAAIDDESIGDIDADIADDDLGEIGTEEVEEEPEED
jgi:DNA-directed RNA polymerase subunit omega